MANKTPALGRLRVGANTGRASSRSPMAARRRSMDRLRGLASRLFAAASLGGCGTLSGGCSATGSGVSSTVLAETTANCTCEPASGREGETWFRTRFPAEPTETLAHGFFAKAEPAGNPTIAHLLRFETENGAVSLMEFLVHGRTDYRPSPRAQQPKSCDFHPSI